MVAECARGPRRHWGLLRPDVAGVRPVHCARLYAAPEVLADHPRFGRVVPEYGVEHIREVIREGYRVVYVLAGGPESGEAAEVLAVLHGRQDLGRKLRRE